MVLLDIIFLKIIFTYNIMDNISILIPTYNRHKFLELCIDNLKNQSYNKKLLEVVILDDGTIPFINDLNKFKDEIKPIQVNYIKDNTKRTIGFKRNKLVKLAKHKIVCFMDDDDIYNDDYIKYSHHNLKINNAGLVGSNEMIFVFPYDEWKITMIKTPEKKMIHEGTIMMTKKYFNSSNKFETSNEGEGSKLINNNDKRVVCLECVHIMICVAHNNNTINKKRFNFTNKENIRYYTQEDNKKKLLTKILNIK
tara:strand:- start:525 stop:1280 length:756 start_codon:yes stop_codon:yes gene_type:complete